MDLLTEESQMYQLRCLIVAKLLQLSYGTGMAAEYLESIGCPIDDALELLLHTNRNYGE